STAWTLPGEPDVKTYTDATMGIDCTITVQQGKATWVARKGQGAVASGSCALDFTHFTLPDGGVLDGGVLSLGMQGNTEAFTLTGEVRGHLEASPGTGSTGTVNVTMDFDG